MDSRALFTWSFSPSPVISMHGHLAIVCSHHRSEIAFMHWYKSIVCVLLAVSACLTRFI